MGTCTCMFQRRTLEGRTDLELFYQASTNKNQAMFSSMGNFFQIFIFASGIKRMGVQSLSSECSDIS
jgi:hypothetical protein